MERPLPISRSPDHHVIGGMTDFADTAIPDGSPQGDTSMPDRGRASTDILADAVIDAPPPFVLSFQLIEG